MKPANALTRWPTRRPKCAGREAAAKGFTLIELMIAVAVLVILASIAYPSYQDSIRKSRRSDAMVALQQIQMEQERFRATCPNYAKNLAGTKSCGANSADSFLGLSNTSAGSHYSLDVTTASESGYTAIADATGAQASDTACSRFTLTVSGLTVTPTATSASCWVK